jgi:hypothetical protein
MNSHPNKPSRKIPLSDIVLAAIVIPILSIMTVAFSTSDVKHDPKTDLYWMIGTWQNTAEPNTYEKWDYGLDALNGKAYTLKDGKETILENLSITSQGHSLFYHATVLGQNEGKTVTFKLTQMGNNSFTFSNPEHDFPKEITYINAGNNELKAIVSDGQPNGKGFTVTMKKVLD